MISTRAPSRAPFTVAVEITSGPRTCSRAPVGSKTPRRTTARGQEPLSPQNGRRRLILPRPRLVNVIALIESMECATTRERRKALPRFDERLAKAARRREPAVGQEAVSSRSRMRRPVRSQWLTQRHDRLNTACCLSAKGVAKTKQRFDRAVGPAVAPCTQMQPPRHVPVIQEVHSTALPVDCSNSTERILFAGRPVSVPSATR